MPLGRTAFLAVPLLIAGLIAGCGGGSTTTVTTTVVTTSAATTTAKHAATAMVLELQQCISELILHLPRFRFFFRCFNKLRLSRAIVSGSIVCATFSLSLIHI